jgi:hypothetical protein
VIFLFVIVAGQKRKNMGVPLLLRNKNRKKQLFLKRRSIYFQKHESSARNVVIMRRSGFYDKLVLVMNPRPGFLPVRNVSIAGGNIKKMVYLR